MAEICSLNKIHQYSCEFYLKIKVVLHVWNYCGFCVCSRCAWRWLLNGWPARTVWWRIWRQSKLSARLRRSVQTRRAHWRRTAWPSRTCGSTVRSSRRTSAKTSPVSSSSNSIIYRVGQKAGLFLRSDDFATTNDRKACNTPQFSVFV